MEQGKIVIRRCAQYANARRSINIFINGIKAGGIKNGETKEFLVPSGEKEIYAKIDWTKTYPMHFVIRNGEIKNIELGCHLKGWKLWIGFVFYIVYYLVLNTKEYLYLKEI